MSILLNSIHARQFARVVLLGVCPLARLQRKRMEMVKMLIVQCLPFLPRCFSRRDIFRKGAPDFCFPSRQVDGESSRPRQHASQFTNSFPCTSRLPDLVRYDKCFNHWYRQATASGQGRAWWKLGRVLKFCHPQDVRHSDVPCSIM